VALVPMILGLFVIGRLVSSRSAVVARLAERHEELRRRREQTARLAAEAERERIAEGLDDLVRSRIAEIAQAAEVGRGAIRDDAGDGATHEAFDTIERTGRETLRHMRHVVGTLLEEQPPKQPQPDLDQLEQLVNRAEGADIDLRIVGNRRLLPAGLELSAYRTVEHLLDAFGRHPDEQIVITIDFGAEQLKLAVSGPAPTVVEQQAALAASRARVALHNGALSSTHHNGQWEATARLPLPVHA
jgi:hypothetical protein